MKIVVFAILFLVLTCESKVFTRCKLAVELLKTEIISKTFLGNWVCLIEQVSKKNTNALTQNSAGMKFYGLYQIPQQYCREGKRGGICNIPCEALLDDDIRDDTVCANYIFEEKGFKFWSLWTMRCKNNYQHVTMEIFKCPDLSLSKSLSQRQSPELNWTPSSRYHPLFNFGQ